MPQGGAPGRFGLGSGLGSGLVSGLGSGLVWLSVIALAGCPTKPAQVEQQASEPVVVAGDDVDAPRVCESGCTRLERCVPELASAVDGDPAVVAERLADTCDVACTAFADVGASLALRDCLTLDSCEAYWGCLSTDAVQPWFATIAPVGERGCANLCSQAAACAVAKVCETEGKRGRGQKTKPGADADTSGENADQDGGSESVDPACVQDAAQRAELEERCLLTCEATPAEGLARTELIGCIDHGSCGGMLACLDSWAATDYADAEGPVPGISPTCDAFCTRAIVCGAAADPDDELEPEELAELKQTMTSTYVECAVQCGQDLEVGGEAVSAAFDSCIAAETCAAFELCADEV